MNNFLLTLNTSKCNDAYAILPEASSCGQNVDSQATYQSMWIQRITEMTVKQQLMLIILTVHPFLLKNTHIYCVLLSGCSSLVTHTHTFLQLQLHWYLKQEVFDCMNTRCSAFCPSACGKLKLCIDVTHNDATKPTLSILIKPALCLLSAHCAFKAIKPPKHCGLFVCHCRHTPCLCLGKCDGKRWRQRAAV